MIILFFILLFCLSPVSFKVNQIAAKKTTFVQLINGSSLVISEQDYLYRHPEVIKNTVRQWVNLTFNWDGIIPGTKELDKGRDIGKGKRVTTNTYIGSFLQFVPSMIREEDKIVEIRNKAVYARPAASTDTSCWAKEPEVLFGN